MTGPPASTGAVAASCRTGAERCGRAGGAAATAGAAGAGAGTDSPCACASSRPPAVFAGVGRYASAQAFSDGFAPAIGVSAGLSLAGATVGLALPTRREATDTARAQSDPARREGNGVRFDDL